MRCSSVKVDPINSGMVDIEVETAESELLVSCSQSELEEACRDREDELVSHFSKLIVSGFSVDEVYPKDELDTWAESNGWIREDDFEEEAIKRGFVRETEV